MSISEKEYSEGDYIRKFRVHSCPRCLSRKVVEFERTKGEIRYRVYECARCKGIIAREKI